MTLYSARFMSCWKPKQWHRLHISACMYQVVWLLRGCGSKLVLTQRDNPELLVSSAQFHQVSALSLLQWACKCEGDDDRGDANRTSHRVYNPSLGTCHGPVSTGLQMRGGKLQRRSCRAMWLLHCLCGDIWLLAWRAFGSTSALKYKNFLWFF